MADEKQNIQYPFYIHDQYVKDLSFENPNFLMRYQEEELQPNVSVNVETKVNKFQDNNFEVTLNINIKSDVGGKDVFLLDLVYASFVSLAEGLDQETQETILLVHAPFLMFPYARNIVSEITRNGGYPPLMIEPIDFAALYVSKKQQAAGGGDTANQQKPN